MDLYIIQSDVTGDFKIGRSKQPNKRLFQLQTGSPYKLKIILVLKGMGHLEKQLHRQIKSNSRKCKGEWFDFEYLSYLPDNIYEQFDLEDVNCWWDKTN